MSLLLSVTSSRSQFPPQLHPSYVNLDPSSLDVAASTAFGGGGFASTRHLRQSNGLPQLSSKNGHHNARGKLSIGMLKSSSPARGIVQVLHSESLRVPWKQQRVAKKATAEVGQMFGMTTRMSWATSNVAKAGGGGGGYMDEQLLGKKWQTESEAMPLRSLELLNLWSPVGSKGCATATNNSGEMRIQTDNSSVERKTATRVGGQELRMHTESSQMSRIGSPPQHSESTSKMQSTTFNRSTGVFHKLVSPAYFDVKKRSHQDVYQSVAPISVLYNSSGAFQSNERSTVTSTYGGGTAVRSAGNILESVYAPSVYQLSSQMQHKVRMQEVEAVNGERAAKRVIHSISSRKMNDIREATRIGKLARRLARAQEEMELYIQQEYVEQMEREERGATSSRRQRSNK